MTQGVKQGDFIKGSQPDPTPSNLDQSTPTIETYTILIPLGRTGIVEQGNISPKKIKRYLIRVNSDQILQVSINGNARISVFYIDGRPIEDANGLQSVSLQMPTSGDYTIEITSTNTTDFQLNVDVL